MSEPAAHTPGELDELVIRGDLLRQEGEREHQEDAHHDQ